MGVECKVMCHPKYDERDDSGENLVWFGLIQVSSENLSQGWIGGEAWVRLLGNEKFWRRIRVTCSIFGKIAVLETDLKDQVLVRG